METLKPVVSFLIVAAMAASVADAHSRRGIVHVNGTLYCSTTGTSSAAAVFKNAVVQVACQTDVMANAPVNATTGSNGAYLVVLIPRSNATVSSIVSGCKIFVLTPLSRCYPSLPSAGLVSGLRYVETVPVGFGYITYMAASGFTVNTS